MHRENKNHGFKGEPNWLKCYVGGQADQDEVLDDCYHVTSVLGTFSSKGHVII